MNETAIYTLIGIFVFGMIIYNLIEKSIHVVNDKNGDLAFKVYQKAGYGFLVRGFQDYPREVRLRTYVDVVAYVDKHLNGF
jgi:hypothetical protein